MKKILITGAAGFIGSYLSRALLHEGYDIIGIDNFSDYYSRQAKEFNLDLTRVSFGAKPQATSEVEIKPIYEIFDSYYNYSKTLGKGSFFFRETDIRDRDALSEIFKEHNFDCIIHLAAMAGVDLSTQEPSLYVDVNVLGTTHLLDLAVKHGVKKFLFASSSSVYGEINEVPFKENDNVDMPVSPYAATKRMQEIMNYTYNYLYNLPIINVRVFGPIFGPLQRPYRMLVQRFINQTYHNQPMTIFGDGNVGARDTTYIDDEIAGIIACLKSEINYDTINIGSGKTITPLQTAETIIKLMGKGSISYQERPKSEVPITFADTEKAEKMLNYKAEWQFEDGLKRQIEVFLAMPQWYKDMQS